MGPKPMASEEQTGFSPDDRNSGTENLLNILLYSHIYYRVLVCILHVMISAATLECRYETIGAYSLCSMWQRTRPFPSIFNSSLHTTYSLSTGLVFGEAGPNLWSPCWRLGRGLSLHGQSGMAGPQSSTQGRQLSACWGEVTVWALQACSQWQHD